LPPLESLWLDEEATLGRAEKLTCIAAGRVRSLDLVAPWPWPTLHQVLRDALAYEPQDRPTAAELADALQHVA